MKLSTEPITKNGRFWNEVNTLAKETFPPQEYLAPSKLVEMAEADDFDFLALTENSSFVEFIAVRIDQNLAYLFFLAIVPSYRSKGYGSRVIETLKVRYLDKKQVVDFEMLDDTANNYRQRQKRREFYLRNGYRETGMFLTYLGVNYEVFCMDQDFDPEKFIKMMETIQIDGFDPEYFYK